jgi:hypothetical protein
MQQSPVKRRRGQWAKATKRLGDETLAKNIVVRCSDELYQAARAAATSGNVSLSDYVRSLILTDLEKNDR